MKAKSTRPEDPGHRPAARTAAWRRQFPQRSRKKPDEGNQCPGGLRKRGQPQRRGPTSAPGTWLGWQACRYQHSWHRLDLPECPVHCFPDSSNLAKVTEQGLCSCELMNSERVSPDACAPGQPMSEGGCACRASPSNPAACSCQFLCCPRPEPGPQETGSCQDTGKCGALAKGAPAGKMHTASQDTHLPLGMPGTCVCCALPGHTPPPHALPGMCVGLCFVTNQHTVSDDSNTGLWLHRAHAPGVGCCSHTVVASSPALRKPRSLQPHSLPSP